VVGLPREFLYDHACVDDGRVLANLRSNEHTRIVLWQITSSSSEACVGSRLELIRHGREELGFNGEGLVESSAKKNVVGVTQLLAFDNLIWGFSAHLVKRGGRVWGRTS
jgi:hypothetical protein